MLGLFFHFLERRLAFGLSTSGGMTKHLNKTFILYITPLKINMERKHEGLVIVLPEVSNSHRGGHPPLPPPSSLHKLKITEVGEGGVFPVFTLLGNP